MWTTPLLLALYLSASPDVTERLVAPPIEIVTPADELAELPLTLAAPGKSVLALSAALDSPEPYEVAVVTTLQLEVPLGDAALVLSTDSVFDGAQVSPDAALASFTMSF
jgi:hypothetical protein